jgi:MFS family permease
VRLRQRVSQASPALKFVVLVGVMSFFADFTYEGSRSIIGPYLGVLATGGTGSLLFGRLYDRVGIGILVPLTLVAALYAPLVFLGGFWPGLVGVCLWGLGMGVHESIIPAAVAPMVSPDRRASAYGLFTAAYGISWFAGSIVIGVLFGISLGVVVAFAILTQLAAIPLIVMVRRRTAMP